MATLQYTTWYSAAEVANGPVLNENVISIGGTSTQSSTVMDPSGSNQTRRVRIATDADCWVTWGADPTALNTGLGGRMLGSGNPEYFDIKANEKIAVISRP